MLLIEKKKNFFSYSFRKLIKNFLKKIFFQGYPLIKIIIIKILSKIKFYRFFLNCLIIKLQYPVYWRLPLKHIFGIKLLIDFSKICEEKKIVLFLIGGSLLGAIRQKSFAGRPTDVDVGVMNNSNDILDEIVIKFKKLTNPITIKKFTHKKKYEKLQFYYDYLIFDINIFSIQNNKYWFNRYEYKIKNNKKNQYISFSLNDLKRLKKTKIYNEIFNTPNNSTQYLKKKYGSGWKTPDSKQFVWR